MKPRANLGNRTRQPKGCANRIAKPARLGRTSQNHLMMIVLNKTGATTVAQPKTTGIQQCNNAKTAPFQRFLDTVTAIQNLLPAAFGVSTREPAALFFAAGGHSPTGGVCCMCDVGTFVRLCFGVSCGIARARSFVCDRGRACRGHVVAVAVPSWPCRGRGLGVTPAVPWPWPRRPGRDSRHAAPWFLCRYVVVATRRWMLVFAMVLTASHYPDLHNRFVVCIVIAIKQTATKGAEMNERPPPRRPPPQGR